MALLRISALAVLVTLSTSAAKHKTAQQGVSLISKPEFRHRLRVCNAYTSKHPIDVQRKDGKHTSNLTKSGPLLYKACQDFAMQLEVGNSIWFRMNNKPLGVFSVTALPRRDALLLLVPRRKNPASSTLTFSSHVFASLLNAQIAVLDAYSGRANGRVVIRDSSSGKLGTEKEKENEAREESLSYNTVVAINPGKYECALLGGSHGPSKPLVGLNRENYVLLRVGEEDNPAFPQELVVFPGPLGGAGRHGLSSVALLVVLAVLHLRGNF